MADINKTRSQVATILLNAESMCKRGGLPGQVLAKASESDFDMKWVALTVSVTVTLPASGWGSSKTQTVTVSGVLADETKQLITPAPAASSQAAYYNAGIRCTGQAANELTFTAETIPSTNLTVYVTVQEVSAS